ncbi:hypothetical protein ACEWY4_007996 [Coilia grayii]|uniref:Uncharacterized protein n=1 Tax=Coilia grayii TaxID=363190 RepID=A0ABD1K9L0_9TELE
MYRGEIFAYPLFLQKELASKTNCQFFCTDIMCRYWPYLEKVVKALPDLKNLVQMKPFLSVMHAKGHSTKCEVQWGGKNQAGAGTTLGEEVEQVNSYMSRVALTTKYMSKSAPDDLRTDDSVGLQHLIEGLFLGIQQKKKELYRVADHDTTLGLKKRVFDQVMLLDRLTEEETILVVEMKQHWNSLLKICRALKDQATVLSDDLGVHSYPSGLLHQAYHGLHSAVLEHLEKLKTDLVVVKETYQNMVVCQDETAELEDDPEDEDVFDDDDNDDDDDAM